MATWKTFFPNAVVTTLETATSYHNPLFFKLGVSVVVYKLCRFRFENSWIRDDDVKQLIVEKWQPNETIPIAERIKNVRGGLKTWSVEEKAVVRRQLGICKRQMRDNRGATDAFSKQLFVIARAAYNDLLKQQEVFWRQRAK